MKRHIVYSFVFFVLFLLSGSISKPVMAAFSAAGNGYCDDSGAPVEKPTASNPRANTALGCVPLDVSGFVVWLLPKLFSIVGGISFVLMVYGFILLITSNGDPKAVGGAQETITSAITGLLLSIFSLFILRLITVDILQIPGIN